MFHYGRKPINDIKKDITNINILQKNIYTFPEPIFQTRIKINGNIDYKDCFEISLLRFIHIVFGKENRIDMNKLQCLMGNGFENNELYNFLSQNNIFENETNNNSTIFLNQRTNWCIFLNNREFFQYKIDGKYKLSSSIFNFFSFFKNFFNFRFQIDNDNKNLSNLMKFLNPENQIVAKLYKNGYIGKDKIFEESIIKIYINGNNLYNWQMYQYFENNNNKIGNEITGYSELRYSVYLDKFYVNNDDNSDSSCSIIDSPAKMIKLSNIIKPTKQRILSQ